MKEKSRESHLHICGNMSDMHIVTQRPATLARL